MTKPPEPKPYSLQSPSIPGPMHRIFEPKPRRRWFQFWRKPAAK